jgi:dipeptidyl aminopeptidase/acylaminoacyl peptidase
VTTAPYAAWRSPITSDLIAAQSIGLSEIRIDPAGIFWLELRPAESGRSAIVQAGAPAGLVPPPFSVRTRTHEYGGGAWTTAGGVLYFSNDGDQRLYALQPGAAQPVAITPPGPMRYADGVIDTACHAWIGIREDHGGAGEPVNTVVRIALDQPGAGEVLACGHDFYSSPRLSPDGRWLAWLAWDHPRMPWVGTTLYAVRLDEAGFPAAAPMEIAGGRSECIFQPEWSPDGAEIYFISDRTGWGNLYACALETMRTRPLLPMEAEFGYPQWVFGLSTYALAGGGRMVCSYTSKGLGRMGVLDPASGRFTPLDLPFSDFSSVRALGSQVVFRGGSVAMPAGFVRLDLDTGRTETLRKSTTAADDPAVARHFTRVEAVEFPTTGGATAYGLYYPPFNADYQAPAGDKPPLLVKCHGGPTAAASSTLDLRTQFWTSRGIAILDVNYGGSTGFGRAYRERLDGNWGIVDVDDCVAGARYLADRGLADAARLVITGGSAGGYTTLAALTFRDCFRGGASHYGIGDLAVLARDTHKFESRYLDGLIGPYPERRDLYEARSPLAHVERLSAPVIFFQGEEDRVVPPGQAEQMVEALRRKGAAVGYFLFAGEQHGFRKAENIKRCLDAELYFYAINVFHTRLAF